MANGSVSARTAVALCLLLMALGLLPQSSAEGESRRTGLALFQQPRN